MLNVIVNLAIMASVLLTVGAAANFTGSVYQKAEETTAQNTANMLEEMLESHGIEMPGKASEMDISPEMEMLAREFLAENSVEIENMTSEKVKGMLADALKLHSIENADEIAREFLSK